MKKQERSHSDKSHIALMRWGMQLSIFAAIASTLQFGLMGSDRRYSSTQSAIAVSLLILVTPFLTGISKSI